MVLVICLIAGFRPVSWAALPQRPVDGADLRDVHRAGHGDRLRAADFQGFQLVMGFLVMPMFFLSGALLSAAGGKLVAMYGRATNGPGVMVIFDVTDPAMAPAITGVAVSAGSFQNVQMTRLFTMEEIAGIRQKARQIRGAYKPPGQQ